MPARDEQIGERAGHEQPMSVFSKPAVAHVGKAEDPLGLKARVTAFTRA